MRVLLVNQAWHPDVVATAQHAHDFATHLARAGHEVHAIGSRSLYNGRGATLPAEEIVESVHVHRVGRSLFGKSTFALRGLDSLLFLVAASWRALRLPRPDVVVVLTNPPFVALVGRLLAVTRGVPYVYWVMDLYPDLPVACDAMRADALTTRLLDRVNVHLVRSAARSVVLGRCMRRRLAAKGIDAESLPLVPPWADKEEIRPVPRDENPYRRDWALGDSFVVMYSGNFGLGHDFETPLRAALALSSRDDVAFVFAGAGKRKRDVERFAREHPEVRMQVHPHQPRERIHASLSVADAHLVTLEDRSVGIQVPSKLFGIMAAARPAVYVGPEESELALIVRETGCGVVVRPGDVDGLVRALGALADDPAAAASMGRRGREAVERLYDRRIACARLEDVVVDAAGRSPAEPTESRT